MQPNRYKWLLIGLLFMVGAVNYADRTAFSTVLPLLKQDLGLSDVVLGAVGSVFLWSYGLVSPFAGLAGDRFARTSMILTSLVAWSLVTGLSGLVRSGPELLGMRVLLGFSEALYIPAALALIADYHSSGTRAKAMAIHIMGLNFGIVLGGSLAGFLGERFGWRASLLVLSATGFALAGLCRVFFDKRVRPPVVRNPLYTPARPSFGVAMRTLFSTPSYIVLMLDAMLTSIGTWVFAYWLPLFYKETFHMSLTSSGLYGTLAVSAGAWLGILSGGWLSDKAIARSGVRNRMILQVFCYAASTPFLLSFVWSNSAAFITLSVFCYYLFLNMGASNNNPLVCDLLEPKIWSTSIGVMNLANCTMGGFGIFFAGFFTAAVVAAAICLLIGYFVFLEKDLRKRRIAEQAPA
ncbi:MAG: MFS transporter [Acidobacteria bacterium]|nr:MFS transporter [Acidobacteriota bacterium]